MPIRILPAIAAALLSLATAGSVAVSTAPGAARAAEPGGHLAAFRSEAELLDFLKKVKKRQTRVQNFNMAADALAPPPASAPTASMEAAGQANALEPPSITNNQEAGVDEGGIVKQRGDMLVILRRGRVFTVSLAGGGMRPIDSIDAFPPGVSAESDWYDEMLVSGDRVIVVGYSYGRGGTEINRFRLSSDGRLRFEDAWHLRSNDYYSSRNYASRLIGNRLVFYTPLYLGWGEDPLDVMPGVRRWQGGKGPRGFRRIASARQIYIAPGLRDSDEADVSALHTVTSCDLSAAEIDCSAIGVLGPPSHNFYVSGRAVYLWTSDSWSGDARGRRARASVYRLPLDPGERPSAVAARGAPVDQFSFREDAGEGVLNVLLRDQGGGDWMFRPEVSGGGVALLRLPISDFGNGSREAPLSRYRALPAPKGESWNFHNRFVGDHVLYGGGAFGETGRSSIFVARLKEAGTAEIPLAHALERIDAIGRDAIAIGGARGGLGFTAIELRPGAGARRGAHYLHPDSAEGESRSHAFFFRPDPGAVDGASGLVGLPVARRADPAFQRFFGSSAALLFLRRLEGRLSPAGELEARVLEVGDDGCVASCVDWYGNARPIFIGGRTFALLGYELVEGRLREGRIREVGRANFSPPGQPKRRQG